MEFRKLSLLLAFSPIFFSAAAEARPLVPVFDKKADVVIDHRGNCVRTKWSKNPNDLCGFTAQAPEPDTSLLQKRIEYIDLVRQSIYFNIDKDNIDADDEQRIQAVMNEINQSKGIKSVKLVGYADRFATNKYNMKLSDRRAQHVLTYFRSKGYLTNVPVGFGFFGEEKPVTNCSTKLKKAAQIACLQADRRVDIEIELVREKTEVKEIVTPPAYPRPGTEGIEVYSRPVNPAVVKQINSAKPVEMQPMQPEQTAPVAPAPSSNVTAAPVTPVYSAPNNSDILYERSINGGEQPGNLDALTPRQ